MAHGSHVNPRVCRGNVVPILGASSINDGVLPRLVFI